jgi:hypothetical protein
MAHHSGSPNTDLEQVIDDIAGRHVKDSGRLVPLADYAKRRLEMFGLPNVRGGAGGELKVAGIGRTKAWDVAYEFAGKFRLLISLKSMWKNIGGTVPNRLDDLMGELANVQQFMPEVVIGYILIFDATMDKMRRDGKTWSAHFEDSIRHIAIRRAPLWNQGLLEGFWFIRFRSDMPNGSRIVEPASTAVQGDAFFKALVAELHRREPAVPLTVDPTAW